MSKLEELIKQYCPNGIKYTPLKNMANFHYGKGNNIPENRGEYPVYGCNGIVGYTDSYNCENVAIIGHIGSAGIINWAEGKCFATYNGTIAETKEGVESRFLYYLLSNLNLPKYVKGSQPFLSVSDFEKIEVPLPALPIQKEIVKILDKFTELNTELNTIKKQYEYYRNELLDFANIDNHPLYNLIQQYCSDGVKYEKVGDICTIEKGKQLNKDLLLENGMYPVVNGGVNPSGYWNEYNYSKNLITISQGGASAGFVNFIEKPFWAGAHCYVISKCADDIDYRYLYHFIKMQQNVFMNKQYGAGIPSLAVKEIKELEIPLLALQVQEEIVKTLDKFSNLITSMEDGIPGQIENNKKRYEYYRDKLLNFNKYEEKLV